MHTEAEAKSKRAFADCGETWVGNPIREGGEPITFTTCIASACIGWIWDDQEFERFASHQYKEPMPPKTWILNPSFPSHYTEAEIERPDGASCFISCYLNMPADSAERKKGWWGRPNPNRRGHCGRVVITAILEQP